MINTHHLNTDLEIESDNDLSKIIEEFGEEIIVLYQGEGQSHNRVSFEVATNMNDPDDIISFFCILVEGLSEKSKEIWKSSFHKVFDIGYEAGEFPSSYHSEIRHETIKRVADLGANIAISIYPKQNDA